MKVLFITRKYPPQVGGMENLSYNLTTKFPAQKKIIALRKPRPHIIWFLPFAAIKALIEVPKYDLLHLGDAVLTPIGYLVKKIYKKPVVVNLHGLDLTYNNPLYQAYLKTFGRCCDSYVCISQRTEYEAKKRGFKNLITVPIGIDADFSNQPGFSKLELKKLLERKLNLNLSRKKIILTVGRLVTRKGHFWFIKDVFSELPKETLYLIAGEGPERENLEQLIKNSGLEERVILLGKVSDEDRSLLLKTTDLFLMPNIKVENDVEGFGIVALEAAASGLPVIASEIEGIRDAIQNGENGFLIQAGNAGKFKEKINELLGNEQLRSQIGKKAKEFTIQNYSWRVIIKKYSAIFSKVIVRNC